jgi:hypothetical protein
MVLYDSSLSNYLRLISQPLMHEQEVALHRDRSSLHDSMLNALGCSILPSKNGLLVPVLIAVHGGVLLVALGQGEILDLSPTELNFLACVLRKVKLPPRDRGVGPNVHALYIAIPAIGSDCDFSLAPPRLGR